MLNKYIQQIHCTCKYILHAILVCIFCFVCLMVFNATLIYVSYIVAETEGPAENHRPVTSHWQTLSHNVVHLAPIEIRNHTISGDTDRHWLYRSGLDINVCPIDLYQWKRRTSTEVDLVSRFPDGTSEKMTVLPFDCYFLFNQNG